MDTDKYLVAPEVMKILRVSASTLARWRKENKILNFIRVGRSIRYRESDIYLLLNVTEGGAK